MALGEYNSYENKLLSFIRELQSEVLSDEEEEFYNAFAEANEMKIVQISDLMRLFNELRIINNNGKIGARHIIIRHYKTSSDYVTAREIVKMGEIIKTTIPAIDKDDPRNRIYEKTISGVRFRVVIGIRKGTGTLITFFSNRKKK